MIRRIAAAAFAAVVAVFLAAAPAIAQFADQATYGGTGAGTANAQTVNIPNATQNADLLGVLIKYIPNVTNTGDATLTVTGVGVAVHVRKPSAGGPTLLTGGELVAGQSAWLMYDGTYFNLESVTSTTSGAANLANSALSFGFATNLQLNASVGSNNLTIAVKGNNGSDPSGTNPVLIPFRDSTIANGDPNIVSLQGALSFTINSSNTMGCVSGQMCRLWVVAICSTGLECTNSAGSDVVALCAFNALSGQNVAPINEAALQTSASGTNGGSSAQTYYCNVSAVTARAIRILGYVDVQEATAGTWASAPTYVQLFGPGIKKPGDVVQTIYATNSTATAVNTTTKTITSSVLSISPTAAANVVRIRATGGLLIPSYNNSESYAAAQIARSSAGTTPSNLIGTLDVCGVFNASDSGGSAGSCPAALFASDNPNTTSSTQYSVYTWTAGGSGGWLGAFDSVVMQGTFTLEEIMSAIEPANDNGSVERRMVG